VGLCVFVDLFSRVCVCVCVCRCVCVCVCHCPLTALQLIRLLWETNEFASEVADNSPAD